MQDVMWGLGQGLGQSYFYGQMFNQVYKDDKVCEVAYASVVQKGGEHAKQDVGIRTKPDLCV